MSQPTRPGQPNPPPERNATFIEGGANPLLRQGGRAASPVRGSVGHPARDRGRRPAGVALRHEGATARPGGRARGLRLRCPRPSNSRHPSRSRPARSGRRPGRRSPFLTVFDDGRTDGEVIRLREPRFHIGRTEGDLRIPLDGRMSARHVEITYQNVGGLHRWVVTDLQSTHGLYVRVSRTVLADKAEFLVGNGRYRFDAPAGRAEHHRRLRPAGTGLRRDPRLGMMSRVRSVRRP